MPPFNFEDPKITKSIRSVFFGRNPVDAGHHFCQNLSPSHRNYLTSLGLVGSNPQSNSIDQDQDVEDEVVELYDMLARLIPMLRKLYRYESNPNPEIGAAENQEEGAVHDQEEGAAVHDQEKGAVHDHEDGAVHNEEDGEVGNQEEDGAVHNKEAVRNQEEDGAIQNEGDEAVGNQEGEAVGNQEDEAVEDEQVAWLLDLNQFPNLQRHSKLTKREKRGDFAKP